MNDLPREPWNPWIVSVRWCDSVSLAPDRPRDAQPATRRATVVASAWQRDAAGVITPLAMPEPPRS